jgi:hypothetical protein
MEELRAFADAAVKSRFYGFTTPDQMLPLMMIAQAQGRPFVSVVEEYSMIQGRPALKAEVMLSRFQRAGGHIKWTELSDTRCAAVFSHPQCDPVEIDWDMERARQAQLTNPMWKKYPRNMLKARVISDGVRTAFPACLGGLYAIEEVQEFEPAPSPPTHGRGQLGAPENAGEREQSPEPHSEFDGEEVDQTTQPEWPVLEAEMDTFTSRDDLKAWWTTPEKKALKQSKPHLMRAFYRFAYTPRWIDLGEVVEWTDEAGERG